ncbi:MAG: serine/threonine protein kinase [Labilithrix sp.]|nr:serine/threonine protein kinase [Labilithrix sp.]
MLLAGKYRIDRTLGEGGMGVVVAATNEALRQRVAIKLLRTGALANAKALGRFEREARAAASLRSEHVARVLDVGKLEDGRPYMVMEYLEGQDLGDVIDHGPMMQVSDAVDYVLQACEAIAEAHAAGIIHRDLKPKNLFLATTVDGRPLVKVLDFGISKMEDAAEDMSLTRTTEIIGSPSYMSPEQLRASKGVDVRTDIWALGVILYELLTKKVPFEAATVTELVAVVLTEPVPDVRASRPDVPPALAQALMRCLAKPREQRFSSIAELVHAIAPFCRVDTDDTVMQRVARVAAGSGRLPPTTGSGPQLVMLPGTDPNIASRRATAPLGGSASPPGPSGFPDANGSVPAAASSARLNIHGGTSVAWGETQVDAAVPKHARRSRWPLIVAASAGFVLLTGAAAGAIMYVKHAGATPAPLVGAQPSPSPPPPTAPMTLPSGRKDLPPPASTDTAAAPIATAPVEAPTALPSSRVPTVKAASPRPPRPANAGGATPATAAAGGPTAPPPVVPSPPSQPAKPGDDLSNIGRR